MTYNLPGGFKVIATRCGYDTEFETRDSNGDTISTVLRNGHTAQNMLDSLRRQHILTSRGF